MHRNRVLIISVVGAGAAAVCIPDIRAYRQLIAVTRSIRDEPATDGERQRSRAGSPAGRPA